MKRIMTILLLISIVLIILNGCVPTAKSPENNQAEYELQILKNEINSVNRVYNKSLKTAVDKYCENYLSFSGALDIQNISRLEPYLTPEFYKELANRNYNEGSPRRKGYAQNTSVDELYYENLARKYNQNHFFDTIQVLAICYQSVTTPTSSNSKKVIYQFNMKYIDNHWLIHEVKIFKE